MSAPITPSLALEPETVAQIQAGCDVIRGVLGNSVVALYLYGSAVAGGLRPSSDVDLLALIDRSLFDDERAVLIRRVLPTAAGHLSSTQLDRQPRTSSSPLAPCTVRRNRYIAAKVLLRLS